MLTKTCSKCGKVYPATREFFAPNKGGKYGLRPDCKACRRRIENEYRANHLEEKRAHRQRYYTENSERILAYERDRTAIKRLEQSANPTRLLMRRYYREQGLKQCGTCGAVYPRTREFFTSNGSRHLFSRCHACNAANSRAYYKRKREGKRAEE